MNNKGMVHTIDCTFPPSSIFMQPFKGSQRYRKTTAPPNFLASYDRCPSLKHYVEHYELGMALLGAECLAFLGLKKRTIGTNPDFLNSDSTLWVALIKQRILPVSQNENSN